MQSEAETFKNFRSIDDEATLYLKLWNNPGTIFSFLISKHSALFDLLESFLTTKSSEALRASQLACRDVFEISKRDITISMMRNYPQLPHKFMSDKAKIHYLLEVIVHMNLERDSLKRQHQNFTSAVLLKKKAFLKHGVKEALISCVKALNFCASLSCGELQDFALNKFKGIEDELVIKLKSALKEVADGDDEYSLLF
ncbi:hypothetical protein R3W88_033203 [Solanum pinnatisectum]|uniref:Cohesin subunit SCC3/SA HEAT-repeats domain-containing protein n=1 Tax=Solanum pinnatisectum TaxID=50273 RepID=A0AAV9K1P4_9SOLN|nr:hypothetical protein R3W88_033203 [Solanum pinnatisectum]